MNAPVTGAVPVTRCLWCRMAAVRCTAPCCIGFGLVHLRSRLHKCGNGVTMAFTRTAGAS